MSCKTLRVGVSDGCDRAVPTSNAPASSIPTALFRARGRRVQQHLCHFCAQVVWVPAAVAADIVVAINNDMNISNFLEEL